MAKSRKKENILQILAICQVQKRSSIQISPLQPTLHQRLDTISSLILPAEEEAQGYDENDFDEVGDNHGPDAKFVGWSVLLVFFIFFY